MPEEKQITEERIREIVGEVIAEKLRGIKILSDRILFSRDIEMETGRDFIFNQSSDPDKITKIGKTTSDRIGFFGADGTSQQASPTYPGLITISGTGDDADINTNFSRLESWIDDIIGVLSTLGITD